MIRPRTLRRGAVASLLTGLVLLSVLLPLASSIARASDAGRALGQPHVTPAPGVSPALNATITTSDAAAFVPDSIHATAPQTVALRLENTGSYAHTFTLSRNGSEVFPGNWSPSQLYGYFSAHPPLVNVSMPAHSNTSVNISVNASMAGGHFEFVSVVPYQFQAGMWGFLNVTPPVSAILTFYVNASDTYRFVADALDASSVTKFPVQVNVYFGTLGVLSHTFTLSSIPNYNLSIANYTTFFTQHPPLVNIQVPLSAGSYNNGSFILTGPGYYEFICEVQGHFASGMFGFLYAGIPVVRPYAANQSTALVQTEVLVGGGALLGIGLVLAAAASVAGRTLPAAPKPPPH
jgi:uncharacterized cupredoxin-like copper-binding protein